jgi:hypothetical protein
MAYSRNIFRIDIDGYLTAVRQAGYWDIEIWWKYGGNLTAVRQVWPPSEILEGNRYWWKMISRPRKGSNSLIAMGETRGFDRTSRLCFGQGHG